MAANDDFIQQQHRHVEAESAGQLRVGVDIHNFDRRQFDRAFQRFKLGEHFVAQLAFVPMHNR
jgi:hypothetical protein